MKNYIPDRSAFAEKAQALALERIHEEATVDWQFHSTGARLKLKKLYPSISV